MPHSSTDKPSETDARTGPSESLDEPASAAPSAVPSEQQDTRDFPADAPADVGAPDARYPFAADLVAAFGDRYEVESLLGVGGFGSVYRALDRRLNRRVALKVSRTNSTDLDRLLREARALAQLRHPGIVAVFDVDVTGKYCFVVSELLPGPSLAKWLKTNRPTSAEAARIAAEVADALAHAHARSIIHRDVKPANVVFADGRPVLVDFGLALSDLDAAAERGVVSGTPAYMSPEQAGGRAHRPDGRTDVYGLAATLYAMLCGRHPFRGHTSDDILRQVQEDEPQPPRQLRPDLPAELERVCLKGMAKLPGDRYTTAADFAAALRGALAEPSASPPVAPELSDSTVRTGSASAPARGPRTERRQITLLHCTRETAGDEDSLDELSTFQRACAEAVAAHGGFPLQTGGATFLACFGYPVAREDAPRAAVRAALETCRRAGATVLAAVGTGSAVVTESPGVAPVVVGDVATATAALAAHESHSGVVVTDATFRLVEAYFDCEPAGEVKPRGATSAVPVHRVRAERAARNRIEAADPARLSPLVGRDREVALLCERWDLAAEGVRNVILLVADPGLGKSRLVRVMKGVALGPEEGGAPSDSTRRDAAQAAVVEWHCTPYHQASPFYPVTDYFDRAYLLSREPDPARRLDLLLTRLRADGVTDPHDQALFAAVLSVPGGSRLPAITLSPERQKEKTEDAVLDWLAARAERAPVLFVVEDLHWVDPSTEALLARFVAGGDARVLGLFTFRPEYDPPWKGGAVQTQVALNRLTRAQVGELIRVAAGEIPAETVDQIADRTDGVPLFVEEFARLVVDAPAAGVGAAIPATLHDLLLARLDRMASNRDVVQLGAVIGRAFGYAVIRAAAGLDEALLRAELDKLVSAGLLFPKGTHPRTTYTFKHALIQDAAYQSLVKKQRQGFHRTVAEALERDFPEVADTQPELLARHYTEAGDTARGISYWLKAGARARERSAHVEAIRHLARGLELIAARPEDAARDADELEFRMPLSASYIAVRGYAAAEVEEHIQRARVLCERLGPPSPLFHVLMIIWALRFIRGDSAAAEATSGEILALAEARDDSYKAEAHWTASSTAWWAGQFARAAEFAERGVGFHTVESSRPHAQVLQQNCGPLMTSYVAWALFVVGRADAAEAWHARALTLAEEVADKFSIVVTQWQYGFFTALLRDARRTTAFADRVIATSRDESFAFWLALGIGLKGLALSLDGRFADAVPLLREGVAKCDAIGSGILHTAFLGELADALWHTGDRPGAWAALDRAREHNDRLGQRALEAELKRRAGLFLLDESPHDTFTAEVVLKDALTTARAQGARVFELRAALALGRMRAASGRTAEACELVAEVYAAFTEGHTTPDLIAARAFLDTLQGG